MQICQKNVHGGFGKITKSALYLLPDPGDTGSCVCDSAENLCHCCFTGGREKATCVFFGKISEAMKALRWRNNYTMVQINKCTLAAQHRTSPQAGRQNIHFPGIIQAAEDALLYVMTKTYSAIPN